MTLLFYSGLSSLRAMTLVVIEITSNEEESQTGKNQWFLELHPDPTSTGTLSFLLVEGVNGNHPSGRDDTDKIFVGHVNAISGDPQILDDEEVNRLTELIPWIDTVATEPGKIRPFVAMPARSGHSVKAQMATTCLEFEITRLEIPGEEERNIRISVHALDRTLVVHISNYAPLSWVPEGVSELHDHHRLLVDYGIDNGSIIELIHLQRGVGAGPPPPPGPEIENAETGGVVSQRIVEIPGRYFQKSTTIAFNAQILNSDTFSHISGLDPPDTPVPASAYEGLGLPFYHLYDEPSRVSGRLSGLESVAQIDGTLEKSLENLPEVGNVGLLDPRGPKSELRVPWEFWELKPETDTEV
ncbi:integral membrane protein [Fusarium pseudocircinatum]|uniref:Integral membrane protein n=1 Tax=Fusarium pseudocircinatum TaxID=56676 RepID=A0A8H5PBN5_9HYPO|nr:integral membrane protein [Fusarium pseudocircinatum]